MAKKKADDLVDAESGLLDHLMVEAGVDPVKFREGAVKVAGKREHDVDVLLNEHFYGRERRFLRALVYALQRGA